MRTFARVRRRLSTVAVLPLVGGELCLDFVNTTGARASATPRERLRSYGDLLVWGRRATILSSANAARLRLESSQRMRDAERALVRCREAREAIYRVLRPIADGVRPHVDSVAALARLWRAAQARRELRLTRRGVSLTLRVAPNELSAMLWPVVTSAVDLLLSDRVAKLRRCGECDWLFIDTSKNGSRTWCKAACGNRVRARRHYRRGNG